jgi:protein-disulfide isomerase
MSKVTRYLISGIVMILIIVGGVSAGRFIVKKAGVPASNKGLKTKGPENAAVKIIIYSDFQCPACAYGKKAEEKMETDFQNQLRVEFRHFPLAMHRWANLAAIVAECANEQGKFWPMHDKLFDEQKAWSSSKDPTVFFSKYAAELDLDLKKLESCLANLKIVDKIKDDQANGKLDQVLSTPTFLINGRRLVGGKQLEEQGKKIIEEELKKAGKQ